jgi:hypothetical protein
MQGKFEYQKVEKEIERQTERYKHITSQERARNASRNYASPQSFRVTL